ncbi:DUF5819 family protein [Streptomyces sp. NPDC059373]
MEPPEDVRARPGGGGLGALSLPSRIAVALAVAAVAVMVAVHLLAVFLHVAPENTITQKHGDLVAEYIYPEFEQNWKLFAPNPVQQNTHVWARAEVRKNDGSTEITGWVDLTAMDIADIRHNPAPSHTKQNELRRAWSFYTSTHGDQNRPIGARGEMSRAYVQRIVETRFGPRLNGGAVERVQVRASTMPVAAPPWSNEKINTTTTYQVLPWWPVNTVEDGS